MSGITCGLYLIQHPILKQTLPFLPNFIKVVIEIEKNHIYKGSL